MKYVLIFAKTPYFRTPYDQWLKGTGIQPLIIVSEEFAEGYRHLENAFAFKNYDTNQLIQQKALELVTTKKVIAVFARAEADIIRAAQLREIAQMPGQNYESALAYRNKVVMKDHLAQSGISLPKYQLLQNTYQVIQFINEHGYPVVIKPTSESGSFGTEILKNNEDLQFFLESRSIQNMQIECFVEGPMYHIDGFVRNGKLVFIQPSQYVNDCLAFRDDHYSGSVTLSENNKIYDELVIATKKVIAHLPSPANFVFHCELWIKPNREIVFCEIASRTGGALIGVMLEKSHGINLDKEWFFAECGLPMSYVPHKYLPSGGVYLAPQKGILKKLPTHEMPPWIVDHQYNAQIGKTYHGGVKSGLFLAGFVVNGLNEKNVTEHIHSTANWFNSYTDWDL